MENLKVLFEEEKIQKRIKELAEKIDSDYKGKEVVIISILKGAVFFTVDLVKKMKTPIILEVMQVSSYNGTESTGKISIIKDLSFDIEGKDVIIVEDIIDTGYTLKVLKENLLARNPNSLKKVEVLVDYVGYEIPNKFVVGYGFDVDERGRNLPYIGYIE